MTDNGNDLIFRAFLKVKLVQARVSAGTVCPSIFPWPLSGHLLMAAVHRQVRAAVRHPVRGDYSYSSYVIGTQYRAGNLVENLGQSNRSDVAGWFSSTAAWAYTPGSGSYWRSAWSLESSCQ